MASKNSDKNYLLTDGSDSNNTITTIANNEDDDPGPVNEVSSIPICCIKLCTFLKHITIEPTVFVYLFAFCLHSSVTINLLQDKTCRIHFNYSYEICGNLSFYHKEQNLIQQYVTQLSMYSNLIVCIPAIIFVLFLGSWSDRHGRKIPLMLPHIGSFISDLIILINVLLWDLPPEYILISSIPKAMVGGFPCMIMVSNAYIADISKESNRTIRIALLDASFAVGPPGGLLFSKMVYGYFGYKGTYVLSSSLFLINLLYILIRIVETRGAKANISLERELSPNINGEMKSLFDIENIKSTFVSVFKTRENYGRTKILLLMLAMCCMVFTYAGNNFEYLYTEKKFDWDYSSFINFSVTSIVIPGLGVLLFLPLLNLKLHIRDEILALCGCVSRILSELIQAFAKVGYEMYIGAVISVISGFPLVICRSMLSKVVSDQDTGKIFSVLASWESIIPLIASPIYTLTYNSTLDFFPGLYLILGALLNGMAFILFFVIYLLNQRRGSGLVAEIEE